MNSSEAQLQPYRAYVQRAAAPSMLPSALQGPVAALPEGTFFLVSEGSCQPIPEVLFYLVEKCLILSLGMPKVSPRTFEARVYDLKDFYDFLDALELRALNVTSHDVDRYVDSMRLNNSPITGQPYATATVKRRLASVRTFLHWAQDRGLTREKFDIAPDPASRWKKYQSVKFMHEVREPPSHAEDNFVTAIPHKKLVDLMRAAGPIESPSHSDTGDSPGRHSTRLKLECALQAGLRREEITNLLVSEVARAVDSGEIKPNWRYPINVFRKGGDWSRVMFPGWLVSKLISYAENERAVIVDKRTKLDPTFLDHDRLFLRAGGTSNQIASPLNPKSLNALFRDVHDAANVYKGSTSRATDAKRYYGVHALRHTYAVHEYYARRFSGDVEPWKFIQSQLGHKDVQTTLRIYLRVTGEMESEARELVEALMKVPT